jgi:hypothetical protein
VEKMLGYKIPVVWPGDDWFVEDRSRPLAPRRRPRPKTAAQKRTRGIENKRRERRKPIKKPKSSHFPGAFFGFGPEPKPEPKPVPKSEPKPEPKKDSPKKKRPPSRRKKRLSPKSSPVESKDE